MAVVYLLSEDGDVLSLDNTEQVTKSRQNTVTSSSLMQGLSTADGVTVGNLTLNFNGICSYNKINRNRAQEVLPPTPPELDTLIEKMVLSEARFKLYMNTPEGIALLNDVEDVVITSYTLTRKEFLDSIYVSISVEQVFISDAATTTTLATPSKSAEELLAEEKEAGAAAQKVLEQKEKDAILDATRDNIISLAGGAGYG